MSEPGVCPAHFGCVLGSGHEGGCSPFHPGEIEALRRLAGATAGALRSMAAAWVKFGVDVKEARTPRERR